jgi:hypothetical protein
MWRRRDYRVTTYDSAHEKAFVVHKEGGDERRFRQAENGLFYLDVTAQARYS